MDLRRWLAGALATGLLLSCSGSGNPEVTMAEYTVEGPSEVESGAVTLDIRNVGAIDHELVVLQAAQEADDLPVDDSEVQTDGRGIDEIGATKTIKAGEEATLAVNLRPGRYALICNVPGHYQSGMYTSLRVV